MINKNLLAVVLLIVSIIGWASQTISPLSLNNDVLKSDFKLPTHKWTNINSTNLQGKHEIFNIKQDKEHIFLYRVSPGAKIGIQEHDQWEEVAILSRVL